MIRKIKVRVRNFFLNWTFFRRFIESFTSTSYFSQQRIRRNNVSNLVSIILSVKNCEQTIRKCLESLLVQSHYNLEIIVINDGSVDNTQEAVASLAANDKRIKLITLEQSYGTSTGRNIGLSICNAEYITFQDGDDYSHPRRIEKQLKKLRKNQKSRVILCDYVRVNSCGKILCINSKWSRNCIVSMMFTRKTFSSIGYFRNISTSEDSDYFERIKVVYGDKSVKVISSILYIALFSPTSRLFGKGEICVTQEKVTHIKSPEEYYIEQKLQKKLTLIAAGRKKAHVRKKKALRAFYELGWLTAKKDKVAILLDCNKGHLSLEDTLNNILQQDYGRNNLFIVALLDPSSTEEINVINNFSYKPFMNILTEKDSKDLFYEDRLHALNCKYLIEINSDSQITSNTVSILVNSIKAKQPSPKLLPSIKMC